MRIYKQVYEDIVLSVKDIPPESGGILGEKDGVIQFVEYDEGKKDRKKCSYSPNVEKLNLVIQDWQKKEIQFCISFLFVIIIFKAFFKTFL